MVKFRTLLIIFLSALALAASEPEKIVKEEKPSEPLAVAAPSAPDAEARIAFAGKLYNSKSYEKAALNFYLAYKIAETGSEDRETTQYYLADTFMKLGLTYAATEFYYEIVKSGSNIDRIMTSLYTIQNLLEKSPHDDDLIKNDLIFNMEYDFLPGDLLDFSNYYKGEVNFKKRLYKWANIRFSLISPNSYYFNKVKFLKGIQILALDRVEEAMNIFRSIIEDKFQDFNIKNKARQTLARLYYEQGKYKEAYELYVQIDSNVLEQDSVREQCHNLYQRNCNLFRLR